MRFLCKVSSAKTSHVLLERLLCSIAINSVALHRLAAVSSKPRGCLRTLRVRLTPNVPSETLSRFFGASTVFGHAGRMTLPMRRPADLSSVALAKEDARL